MAEQNIYNQPWS